MLSPLVSGQSRSPAVEPQRGISIDRGPEYKNHPGFNFKNGKPISTSEELPQGNGVYAVLFMLALASMPFIMHVIFRGNVVPTNEGVAGAESSTAEGQDVSSLQDFRDKKTSDTEDQDDIKKAG